MKRLKLNETRALLYFRFGDPWYGPLYTRLSALITFIEVGGSSAVFEAERKHLNEQEQMLLDEIVTCAEREALQQMEA